MSTKNSNTENDWGSTTTDSDPRPRYILLGIDSNDHHHYWNTRTDNIRVVGGRTQIECLDVSQRPVDDYMEFVMHQVDSLTWQERYYGGFELLAENLAEILK